MNAFLRSFLVFCIFTIAANAQQPRVVVLPFQNMDGNMKYNVWCYKLQDSVAKVFLNASRNSAGFQMVPADSVEIILGELNINPSNPQYASDMWKAVSMLKVQKVIMGNFNIQGSKFLLNAYIYDVNTKTADPDYQSKDIFKSEAKLMESVPLILQDLLPAFKSN